MQTYFFNKNWTFSYKDTHNHTKLKYLTSYGLGYLLILLIFADIFLLPHGIIQGFSIIIVAIFSFIMQKYWVFL